MSDVERCGIRLGDIPEVADTRESQLVRAFVQLADTLVREFDLVEFLHLLTQRSTELLDVADAGLLLADTSGTLKVMASSSEETWALEVYQLQQHDGPCLDCYRTGERVIAPDLNAERDRWPGFVPLALEAGFAAVHALPLRLRDERVGALGLFGTSPGRLGEPDLEAGQAMADVATIGILQYRSIREANIGIDQLQFALNSRVVIEQAKGVMAERADTDMAQAFHWLRRYARAHNRRLVDVAQDLVSGELDVESDIVVDESPGRARD